MFTTSAAFTEQIKNSHVILTKCEVYADGEYVTDLPIYDGSVSMTYLADQQRRFTAYMGDPDGEYTPDDLHDLLAPVGNELKLYRGLLLNDGTEELVPLGVFPISVTDITESGDGHTIRLEGFDRSQLVSRNKWTEPYIVEEGTLYTDAIKAVVLDRYPRADFDMRGTETFTTPQMVFDVKRDPWRAAVSLAKDIGCDLFFNGNGIIVCNPVHDPMHTEPVWAYEEGEEAMFLSINKRWKNTDLVNYWIVTGESTNDDPPVSASAYDDDPSSPTYIYGKHGIYLDRYQSNSINTEDQAQQVANSLLVRSLGSYEEIRFNSIVHPAHEPGDVISVKRSRIGINNKYVMDKITVPLTSHRAMEVGTRQRG